MDKHTKEELLALDVTELRQTIEDLKDLGSRLPRLLEGHVSEAVRNLELALRWLEEEYEAFR